MKGRLKNEIERWRERERAIGVNVNELSNVADENKNVMMGALSFSLHVSA